MWYDCLLFFFYFTGNDVIHKLTNRLLNSLYVYFRFNNNSIFHQKYAEFSVGAESTNYQLHLAGPTTGSLGTWQEVLLSTKSLIFFLGIIFDTRKANKFYDESYKYITNRLKNIFFNHPLINLKIKCVDFNDFPLILRNSTYNYQSALKIRTL